MARTDARPFTRWDVALVAASATLGVALAWVTDREYRLSHGTNPARLPGPTRLPGWLKERRHDAIRVEHGAAAFLSALSLGAAATLRPRPGPRRRRRLAPGHVASAVSASAVAALAIHLGLGEALGRGPSLPRLYTIWYLWRPMITWALLGAWACLLVSGWRRRPADRADRLGRWVGYGWIALIAGQGLIYVLAWA